VWRPQGWSGLSAAPTRSIITKKRRYAQAALRKETPGGADPLADDLGVLQMSTERLVERVRAGFPFPRWMRYGYDSG